MKKRLIFSFFFSLFTLFFFSQNKKENIEKKGYHPNFMVGVDVLNAGLSPFTKRKLYQGYISSKIKKNIHVIIDVGYDANHHDKNGYDVNVNGFFLKFGGIYMLVKDRDNETNGFYIGAKLAGVVYNQEYLAIPVRGFGGSSSSVTLPATTQSSYWSEAVLGGRVQLFNSPVYIDVNVQPRYLLYSTKQEGIMPMIVSGFGKSSSKFSTGFSWNISYLF